MCLCVCVWQLRASHNVCVLHVCVYAATTVCVCVCGTLLLLLLPLPYTHTHTHNTAAIITVAMREAVVVAEGVAAAAGVGVAAEFPAATTTPGVPVPATVSQWLALGPGLARGLALGRWGWGREESNPQPVARATALRAPVACSRPPSPTSTLLLPRVPPPLSTTLLSPPAAQHAYARGSGEARDVSRKT